MITKRDRVKEICGRIQLTNEFLEELDEQVKELIIKACRRAAENNRKTVMKRDL